MPSHLEPISIVFVYKSLIITCTEVGYVRTFDVKDGRQVSLKKIDSPITCAVVVGDVCSKFKLAS